MTWDYTIKWTDIAIVLATIMGPVLAVQAQKLVERRRAILDRRSWIFRTLMSTRGAMLSPQHIEAFNAVPVEFYGSKGKLQAINQAWKGFLEHHTGNQPATDEWLQKRLDLFIDLLHLIAGYLGYTFTREQLANDIYRPIAHGEQENEQTIIRRGFAKLFNGELSLPMAVTHFPATASDEAIAEQAAIQKALLEVLDGKRAISITNLSPDANSHP